MEKEIVYLSFAIVGLWVPETLLIWNVKVPLLANISFSVAAYFISKYFLTY